MIEKGDYFEDDKQNRYQVIHKNKNEITVAIRTNRDVMIQIRDQNFFDKLTKKVGSPFCNIKNLSKILEELNKGEKLFFLGYIKYSNYKDGFEKRKKHFVYELLFKTPKRSISLMVSEIPAYELLIGSYYTTTWGYNLKQKEIVALTDLDTLSETSIGASKVYVVLKEPAQISYAKNYIQFNNVLKIYTDLREKQVEELKLNRDAYVLEERTEFIDRIN